ncbi:peroxisomal leader peptide-processing protease [Gouania willdenowi]|uniref:Peroxisomal leader peptide-processing protease n=1 Tax=Gouania willdenowi TaxID=441366 RepID=A0A8C5NC97_GOUWI|nr:peroxisomal leader peptide-processing protease [Gouania willdenowi]
MESEVLERCCCVVKLLQPTKKPLSCSGVIVHPPTGTILCTGLLFSRFLADTELLASDTRFLPAHDFSDQLRIRVSFSTGRGSHDPLPEEAPARLLMLVNCLEFKRAFQSLFRDSDQWRFYCDEEDEELIRDAHLLSWFAVLRTGVTAPGLESISWKSSSDLVKGGAVVACGSPFGSLCLDLFISTLSRGIISNLWGEDHAVILTDARCLPGTEGGGLFAVDTAAHTVPLVGIIVSPFGWKSNEWIGLTLVCSLHVIIRSIIHCVNTQDPLRDLWAGSGGGDICMSTTAYEPGALSGYPTVCFVDSGYCWGSGVAVTSLLVLTCRHVVNGKSTVTLTYHHGDRVRHIVGDVLFSTQPSSPYDLALVEMRHPYSEVIVPRMSQNFTPGDPVVVVGYGALGRSCGPSLTSGIISKTISLKHQPVMLQTTCAVQGGTSGGAVVRNHTGELLGIVSSNTRDLAAKVTYPHLNFSIPVTVFQEQLQEFHQTKDVNVFRMLDTPGKEVGRVWRLQGAQSKL